MQIRGSRLRPALALVVLFSSVPFAPAADKRPITETDLFRFVWVADPQISPDGKQVAFVRVTRQREEGRLRHRDLDRVRRRQRAAPRVHQRPRTRRPRWSPDGQRLAFTARGREGRQAAARAALPDLDATAARRARSPTCRRARARRVVARRRRRSPSRARRTTRTSRRRTRSGGSRRRGRGARERRARRSRAPSTASTAAATSTRRGPSHVWTVDVRRARRACPKPRQVTTGRLRRGQRRRGRPTASASTSPRTASRSPTTRAATATSTRCPPAGGEPVAGGQHRRRDRRLRALPRRPADRASSASLNGKPVALLRPARPVRRRRRAAARRRAT